MPPYRRDQPASSAAAVSVFQDRTTSLAGVLASNRELPFLMVTFALKSSVPKNDTSTVRPAALNVLCPETYSGKPGVTTLSCWYGSQYCPSTLP